MNTAPPPSNTARTQPSHVPCSDDDDTSNAPAFFLDSFPKEVLDNVLRFFSRLPEASDWVPHIPVEAVIELYGVTGELGKFMQPRFNTLCISDSFKADSENENGRKEKGQCYGRRI